jgi:hypothetical protein
MFVFPIAGASALAFRATAKKRADAVASFFVSNISNLHPVTGTVAMTTYPTIWLVQPRQAGKSKGCAARPRQA